jgi:site-specific recombinase XerD
MTPVELSLEKLRFSSVNAISTDTIPNEDYSTTVDLETYLEALSEEASLPPPSAEIDYSHLFHSERRKGLEQILDRLFGKEMPGKDHVEAYLRDQYRRHLRVNTLRNSLITMESFLVFVKGRGRRHLEAIVREDLEAYIEHEQDRGIKASTVEMRLRTLKAFIRFLIERDIVRPELLSKRLSVKVPKALPRAMDPDDVKRLVGVIDHVRDRAMLVVLLRSGMRIGELLNTLIREVHLKERRIEIYEAEKTRVGRVVYLSDDAVVALRMWMEKRKKKYAYLFYGPGGKPLTYPAARRMFVKYLEKGGLSHKGYSLHCLRHTFATQLLNAGMRIECLQPLLGHSSLEMTRRYATLTDKSREEEYFTAMAIIERGERDGYRGCDRELEAASEETQLLTSYGEELHEHA